MNILILVNQIQDLISPNCGQFQLYFYKNLFDPDEKSKILSHGTFNKSTSKTIINEIFPTDIDENENNIKILKKNTNCNYYFVFAFYRKKLKNE